MQHGTRLEDTNIMTVCGLRVLWEECLDADHPEKEHTHRVKTEFFKIDPTQERTFNWLIQLSRVSLKKA